MIRNEALYPTACNQFLDENAGTIRTVDSRKTYTKVLRHLQDRHPGRRTSEFTEQDLVRFCNEAGLAPATLLQRRSVCMAFFQWAHWRQLTPIDPSAGLKHLTRGLKARSVKPGNWLTQDQLRALLAVCDDGTDIGLRDRTLIATGGLTGLRRAELAGLRWGDVDVVGRVLSVIGKGEKPATVGLPASLTEALFTWRSVAAQRLGRPPAAADPVFPRARAVSPTPGVRGTLVNELCFDLPGGRNMVYLAVKKRAALAGVPAVAPHDLRRTFAGLLEEQQDLLTVSAALRHSNVGTTQRYLEKNPRRAVQAGQSFDIAL